MQKMLRTSDGCVYSHKQDTHTISSQGTLQKMELNERKCQKTEKKAVLSSGKGTPIASPVSQHFPLQVCCDADSWQVKYIVLYICMHEVNLRATLGVLASSLFVPSHPSTDVVLVPDNIS